MRLFLSCLSQTLPLTPLAINKNAHSRLCSASVCVGSHFALTTRKRCFPSVMSVIPQSPSQRLSPFAANSFTLLPFADGGTLKHSLGRRVGGGDVRSGAGGQGKSNWLHQLVCSSQIKRPTFLPRPLPPAFIRHRPSSSSRDFDSTSPRLPASEMGFASLTCRNQAVRSLQVRVRSLCWHGFVPTDHRES